MTITESLPILTIEEGFNFISGHFEEPIWPRTLSTRTTEGRQILVYSREETLEWFKGAKSLDCKISAYPKYTEWNGINRQAPDFIFIDLDLSHFKSMEALNRSLRRTLKNIKEKLGNAQPTVIWSGNGYHIYLPIKAFILESENVFAEFEKPSMKFLGFVEQSLTNNKADPCHSNNLSFKNCMLRIPGSHNSKCVQRNNNVADSTTEVKIIQKWDGNKPAIKWLLRDFRRHLIQEKINNEFKKRKRSRHLTTGNIFNGNPDNSSKIRWIDILLETPISDYRKNAIWRILAPYLINIKKVSYEHAFNIIHEWLSKCNAIERVDFNRNYLIKNNLHSANRIGYLPISLDKLKMENKELYDILTAKCQDYL